MMEEDTTIFCHTDLPSNSFSVFENMRRRGELCDLTIKVQNYTFVAHRVVLAAGIPYFRAMFGRGEETEQKEAAMENLDPCALESLILYAYTSRVTISRKNVQSLLLASEILQLHRVKYACVEFLSERLCIENVAQVHTFALSFKNRKLIEECNTYIEENFEEFCKSDEFLSLPHHHVREIISKDDLNVSDERVVFEAVMKWIKSSFLERRHALHELLCKIRLIHLPVSYLVKNVATENLIRESLSCMELIQDVQSYHLLPEPESRFLNLNLQPRRIKCTRNSVCAICYSGPNEYSVYQCDVIKRKWSRIRCGNVHEKTICGVAAASGNVYVFLQETIQRFDPETLELEVLHANRTNIEGAAIVSYGHIIYCLGSTIRTSEGTVRSFDTRNKRWLDERKMQGGARSYSAAVLLKKFIYVTGGLHHCLGHTNIVQKYSPSLDSWCEMPSMLTPRAYHSSVVFNEKIYVCGGTTKNYCTSTGEVYNSLTNQWNRISPMIIKRRSFSLVQYGGKIYAFGEKDYIASEIYDTESENWKIGFPVPEGFRYAVLVSSVAS